MKQDKVNVKVVPDVRRSKNDDRFPLKLRITYKGSRKYYATGYDSTEEEWEVINSANAKASLRKIKQEISVIEKDAQKCCDDIIPFSFFQFEKAFFDEKIRFENVESAYIMICAAYRSYQPIMKLNLLVTFPSTGTSFR